MVLGSSLLLFWESGDSETGIGSSENGPWEIWAVGAGTGLGPRANWDGSVTSGALLGVMLGRGKGTEIAGRGSEVDCFSVGQNRRSNFCIANICSSPIFCKGG